MQKLIPLTQGKFAKVDSADYDDLMQYKWCCPKGSRGRIGYAKRTVTIANGKRKDIFMHRYLMGDPIGLQIDHINHDTLDNRRSNLRFATASQNAWNRRGFGKTGVKGVTCRIYKGKRKITARFVANITLNNLQINIGSFKTLAEAECAYNAKATELFGEFKAA